MHTFYKIDTGSNIYLIGTHRRWTLITMLSHTCIYLAHCEKLIQYTPKSLSFILNKNKINLTIRRNVEGSNGNMVLHLISCLHICLSLVIFYQPRVFLSGCMHLPIDAKGQSCCDKINMIIFSFYHHITKKS